jgi:hypothetical protein
VFLLLLASLAGSFYYLFMQTKRHPEVDCPPFAATAAKIAAAGLGSGGRRLILRNLAGDDEPGRAGVTNCQRNVDGRSWKKLLVENFA